MKTFTFFYYFLSLFLYILAIPYILYKSKNKKYKDALPARFFLKNNNGFEKKGIWFHSCSMGETKSLKPIIDKLSGDINISVITNTGFEEAGKLTKNVRYLPYELFLPFWTKKQKALVVMEAELWYMLFLSAKIKKTPTILINARISDKSYNSYKRFSFLYKKIFEQIDKIYAQSQTDKERLLELGASNIEVIGNIKLAILPKTTKELQKPDTHVITAGSTHESEEELILNAYDKSMGKLIIVPRHPERFDKVYALIKEYAEKNSLTYHRYTQKENFDSDIVLIDKMGELINIYAISDTVILGGGFIKTAGGHNPIEPAYFGCKLISGETIFNQKSLFECVKDYKLIKNEELKNTLKNLNSLEKSSLIGKGSIKPITDYLKLICSL